MGGGRASAQRIERRAAPRPASHARPPVPGELAPAATDHLGPRRKRRPEYLGIAFGERMRLVREEDDPWRPLHHLLERHARIPGVARAPPPRHGPSPGRRPRGPALAGRAYGLPPPPPPPPPPGSPTARRPS